ncbi:MAG: hypothetical protein MJ108_08785 [Saccharofermentans sp.]|nr:hypothetical protein [Saccharofermentans sp.]
MKTNCEFCGSVINDHDEKCPSCGATNANYLKTAPKQPKTIEELKLWYQEKKLPPEEVTRFFIGKDIKEAKAFGIYKDEEHGTFVVYKNKADGTRAVRYDGADEEYAVNELFQKLRERMNEEKARHTRGASTLANKKSDFKKNLLIGGGITLGIIGLAAGVAAVDEHKVKKYREDHPMYNQYYEYDDGYYYNLDGDYYSYDEDNGEWYYFGGAPFDEDDYKDYKLDGNYADYDLSDFEDTDYYTGWYSDFVNSDSDSGNDGGNNDDDWDSGWDGGDWDSGGGDWDSDW